MPTSKRTKPGESRRRFLQQTVLTTAAVGSGLVPAFAAREPSTVCIITQPGDRLLGEPPVAWALQQLRQTLENQGFFVRTYNSLDNLPRRAVRVIVSSADAPVAAAELKKAGLGTPRAPEGLALLPWGFGQGLLACAADARGLSYAVLELADRVRYARSPLDELRNGRPTIQRPANRVRSMARLFSSDVEDKPWFYDEGFWQDYLTELALHRFNRFSLMLGLGYDLPTGIRDSYFYFSYPFLISPPGYYVRAVPLPDEERDRNLAMLRFIGEETTRRGLQFHLGLWTHAYECRHSPDINYRIEGLSPEIHARYCRDALEALLQACPSISGVTFRIHGESGIPEGSYSFWQTVFSGVTRCGRRVEVNLHAKGLDQRMLDLALATGMPVIASPKYWAEHMGLGYMQGAIRPLEMPPHDAVDHGFFAESSGSRRFLRYGYGDLLKENRPYGVLHRIWPGTQRLLLWGSPELAAQYGRASSFCGSAGVEWFEPLSFKGRKGSGLPGGRDAYGDPSLRPAGWDFEKYRYTYRVWGRHIYDPDCDPDEYRRYLRSAFNHSASHVELALDKAGQLLPLVTTAHCPSAANNNYWPEMYTNMAIVDANRPHPYGDTLSPKRFGCVSSLDPEFFSRIDDFADELLRGEPGPKCSPAEVAVQLSEAARQAQRALALAQRRAGRLLSPEFRRLAADVSLQCSLGDFFAGKIRAGVLFALYRQTGYPGALENALKAYRQARAAWLEASDIGKRVYRADITFGPEAFQRGTWEDRLAAIDADLADMERAAGLRPAPNSPAKSVLDRAIAAVWQPSPATLRSMTTDFHAPPKAFGRGQPVPIVASAAGKAREVKSVTLRFRRVNQAELWQAHPMERDGSSYRFVIPAEYTDSPFPLQYHFELRARSGAAWLFPGLNHRIHGQPYFVIRQAAKA